MGLVDLIVSFQRKVPYSLRMSVRLLPACGLRTSACLFLAEPV
jgi:hypothetical protein